jgi:hypothetical protein
MTDCSEPIHHCGRSSLNFNTNVEVNAVIADEGCNSTKLIFETVLFSLLGVMILVVYFNLTDHMKKSCSLELIIS